MHYRSNSTAPTLQDDGRTLYGMAAPWNEVVNTADGKFRLVKGAFEGSKGVLLRDGHKRDPDTHIIGKVDFSEEDDGLYIRARVSDTTAGNDALALIKDQVLQGLSVGYDELEGGVFTDDEGVENHSRCILREVSIVHEPLYQTAKVLQVRSKDTQQKGNTMSDEEIADLKSTVSSLRETLNEQSRRIDTVSVPSATPVVVGSQFRSSGEWLKAIADHDTEAVNLIKHTRAFTGTAMADTQTGTVWIQDAIRLVAQNSVAINSFRNAALPATGNQMEYLKYGGSTIQVQEQVAEGDVLAFGKLNLDTASTGIKTYGGYSSLSFQAIKRSPIDVLSMTYELLSRQAAVRSNAASRRCWGGSCVRRWVNGLVNFWPVLDARRLCEASGRGFRRGRRYCLGKCDAAQRECGYCNCRYFGHYSSSCSRTSGRPLGLRPTASEFNLSRWKYGSAVKTVSNFLVEFLSAHHAFVE